MRIPILLLTAAALALSACDIGQGDQPSPPPAGVTATVDGRPFLFNITMGWAAPGTAAPLSISGARMDTDGMRMILLTVPGRVGTYTASSAGVSAGYTHTTASDTTMQMWMAGEGVPGTSLDLRVTRVDASYAEGTFAFTARHVDDPARVVTVTGGTFNVTLGEMPTREAGAILGAVQAFERAQRPHAR